MRWSFALFAMLLFAPSFVAARPFLHVLAGELTGTYYALGAALTKVYGENMPEFRAVLQAAETPRQTLDRLQRGRGEAAFARADLVREVASAEAQDRLRGLSMLYPDYVHVAARANAGIRTLGDLRGQQVSIGVDSPDVERLASAILAAAGIGADEITIDRLRLVDAVQLIEAGALDAFIEVAPLGATPITEVAGAIDLAWLELPPQMAAEVAAEVGLKPGVIPAGLYPGQDRNLITIGIPNVLLTHAGVSEALAYRMTRLLHEHVAELKQAHPTANEIRLEQAVEAMPVPLHPGAERYYREVGLLR